MDELSVDTFQGFRERQNDVSARPIKDSVRDLKIRERNCPYVLGRNGTGG
jgi:hypothetical protein